MDIFNTDSEMFAWVVLPILIFFSRIADQSIGTIRLIFLSKGFRVIAPILGFFEVIIWLLAVTQIIKHVDNIVSYISYGAGFAAGNYIGMWLEEKISIGKVSIRIIPKKSTEELARNMKENNFGVTLVDAMGSKGKVKIIYSVINRKDLKELVPMIDRFNPQAFYTIEDVRTAQQGIFRKGIFGFLSHNTRKSK